MAHGRPLPCANCKRVEKCKATRRCYLVWRSSYIRNKEANYAKGLNARGDHKDAPLCINDYTKDGNLKNIRRKRVEEKRLDFLAYVFCNDNGRKEERETYIMIRTNFNTDMKAALRRRYCEILFQR